MNYLRGAVNAISAPYQYYKDLPPLNPSTLTGAIDVIVIQRPTDNGDIELACSPFHVRFGKWQVLRPGEKKVNVSVNGHPIPFNMKIGEAGEAFFVFETDNDVPEDLITSPILQPTRPDEAKSVDHMDTNLSAAKYPEDRPELDDDDMGALQSEAIEKQTEERLDEQEPEFLDLDAQPLQPVQGHNNANSTPRQSHKNPLFAKFIDGSAAQGLPSPPLTPTDPPTNLSPEMAEQEQRVDEALTSVQDDADAPDVEFLKDLALDAEGYHSHHDRERSDRTIRSFDSDTPFHSGNQSRSSSSSPVRGLGLFDSEVSDALPSSVTFPMLRATSEPPPDILEHSRSMTSSRNHASSSKLTLSPVQEYSWEWGAFPQPSPMKTSFGKLGRVDDVLSRSWKGKAKASMEASLAEFEEGKEHHVQPEHEHEHGRSRSVPPELEGSPTRERRIKELVEEYDAYSEPDDDDNDDDDGTGAFGRGGTLKPSKKDPSRFILQIEGRRVAFELSIVPSAVETGGEIDGPLSEPEELTRFDEPRGRKNRFGKLGGPKVFDGRDEFEASRLFAQGKVDFRTLLENEDVVNDPGLVIRWAGTQYITRGDGSPLMRALIIWREAALQQKIQELSSRPTSPLSEEESEDMRPSSPPLSDEQPEERHHHRSKSEPPEKPQGKPTSTSWVRWWSRSSRKKNEVKKEESEFSASPALQAERPSLRETASAPLEDGVSQPSVDAFDLKRISKEIPPAESAPAYPSTPIQSPVKTPAIAAVVSPTSPLASRKKFAKTLRLTSDQLKSLNLKPGSNSITFSLSATGAIAATARIFVWDSTDSVVVSDIDGTITKSDGLGHVFAMIGRDWTHLGVAKLYTDIRRNGYKIMYLTSRAIGQADATRDYLKGIKQNDYQLPEGPVIMSPDRLMASLHREVIMRKPEVFKMACLRDIQRLFGEASRNPFYSGFGNRITDALSYRSVNVPSARIFTIDSAGEVKMELLELAGYKSSYIHMTDLVDQMFPPINRKVTPEFTDFNYWKVPVQDFPLPDFSPPSPALSARSDTSNRSALARLRNFSLVPSRQGSASTSRMSPPPDESDERRSSHLRQMSSFEKLSNTLGFSQTSGNGRSTSPESSAYDSDDGEGDEVDVYGNKRRVRRRSMTSMPGTLDEMHFGMDDDEDVHYGGDEEGEEGGMDEHMMNDEEAVDEAFDEDLLATGEMKDVPFL